MNQINNAILQALHATRNTFGTCKLIWNEKEYEGIAPSFETTTSSGSSFSVKIELNQFPANKPNIDDVVIKDGKKYYIRQLTNIGNVYFEVLLET